MSNILKRRKKDNAMNNNCCFLVINKNIKHVFQLKKDKHNALHEKRSYYLRVIYFQSKI